MARIRTIKPEFWDDEKMALISRDARLVYIGLWSQSDDYGVCRASPVYVKNKLFPHDKLHPRHVQAWLQELERIGRARAFAFEGENFYYLPFFSAHQYINRPSNIRYPKPPKVFPNNKAETPGGLSEGSVSPPGGLSEGSRPIRRIIKKEELRGKTKREEGRGNIKGRREMLARIIENLNKRTGKTFKTSSEATRSMVEARMAEGYKEEDFIKVIDVKTSQWAGDEKMRGYLRPETLFRRGHFESYLNEEPAQPPPEDRRKPRSPKQEAYIEARRIEEARLLGEGGFQERLEKARISGSLGDMESVQNELQEMMAEWTNAYWERNP